MMTPITINDFLLSPNFSFAEMTDSSSHQELVQENRTLALQDPILDNLKDLCLLVLQPIRKELNKPIQVNSGFRCDKLNSLIGGAKTSQHRLGQAADLDLNSEEGNKELFDLIIKMMREKRIAVGQVIQEHSGSSAWVHVSSKTSTISGQVLTYDGKNYHLVETIK